VFVGDGGLIKTFLWCGFYNFLFIKQLLIFLIEGLLLFGLLAQQQAHHTAGQTSAQHIVS
jgi:hypothetical protein